MTATKYLVLFFSAIGLIAQSEDHYVGRKACVTCHPDKVSVQQESGHAHALTLAPEESPGHWAFGAGIKAITYVSQRDHDSYIEHGLSYYPGRKAMGITMTCRARERRSPSRILAAWRPKNSSRFDFSGGDIKLDVKTASGRVSARYARM